MRSCTEVEIVSPYGKPIERELRAVYKVDSVDELIARLTAHVAAEYALPVDDVDKVHIAFGLVAFFTSGHKRFVYKLTSSRIHSALADLFPWLERQRATGVPLPQVHRTVDGAWFGAPLDGSDYDVGYLMDRAPGQPAQRWSDDHSNAFARLLADVHKLGQAHEPRVRGSKAFFAHKWAEAAQMSVSLLASGSVQPGSVSRALDFLEGCTVPDLPRTHIHGDARLCHVYFREAQITALIDNDQGTWGDRLIDLAYGAVSHPDPALGGFLGVPEIVRLLQYYRARADLTVEELAFLPAALTFAALEQLTETVAIFNTGLIGISTSDVQRQVRLLDEITSLPDLLAN